MLNLFQHPEMNSGQTLNQVQGDRNERPDSMYLLKRFMEMMGRGNEF